MIWTQSTNKVLILLEEGAALLLFLRADSKPVCDSRRRRDVEWMVASVAKSLGPACLSEPGETQGPDGNKDEGMAS